MTTAKQRGGRDAMWVWGISIAIAAVGVGVGLWLMRPAPPTKVVIAAGAEGGAYEKSAAKLAAYFATRGVELEVRRTAGSVENAALLADPRSGVDVALIQGGLGEVLPRAEVARLRAVLAVFYEPVWLLMRRGGPVGEPGDVKPGVRVSLGPVGSGTRALALELLGEMGVRGLEEALALTPAQSLAGLRAGTLDAAVVVMAPEAPLIGEALADPAVGLAQMPMVEALARRNDALSRVTLPRGAVDPARDLPSEDLTLLAPTASVAVAVDTHPAIVALLVQALVATHSDGGLLHEPGVFPSPDLVDLPLHPDVRHHLARGPNLLHRTLPFWLASLIDRLIILAVPLAALLIPVVRSAPPVYRWRIRSRIYRWYKQLHDVDERVIDPAADPATLRADLQRLERIERELAHTAVPLSYMEEYYNLRAHLDAIRDRAQERLAPGTTAAATTPAAAPA